LPGALVVAGAVARRSGPGLVLHLLAAPVALGAVDEVVLAVDVDVDVGVTPAPAAAAPDRRAPDDARGEAEPHAARRRRRIHRRVVPVRVAPAAVDDARVVRRDVD